MKNTYWAISHFKSNFWLATDHNLQNVHYEKQLSNNLIFFPSLCKHTPGGTYMKINFLQFVVTFYQSARLNLSFFASSEIYTHNRCTFGWSVQGGFCMVRERNGKGCIEMQHMSSLISLKRFLELTREEVRKIFPYWSTNKSFTATFQYWIWNMNVFIKLTSF